jgi:hypothetical protein
MAYKCGFCKAESPELEVESKSVRAQGTWLVLCGECRAIISIVPKHMLRKGDLEEIVRNNSSR